MTDHKKIQQENERINEELFATVTLLNEGLEKLDSIDSIPHDEKWFEQFVLMEKENIKRKFRKELALFVLCAMFIISGVLFSFFEIPQLFFVLQAAAIAIMIGYGFRSAAKRVDSP